MSDYLERLIARNTDAPEDIRPRPAAPFESIAAQAAAPSEHIVEEVASKERPAPSRAALRNLRVGDPQASRNEPSDESSSTGTSERMLAGAESDKTALAESPVPPHADSALDRSKPMPHELPAVAVPHPPDELPQPHSDNSPVRETPHRTRVRDVSHPTIRRDAARPFQRETLIKRVVEAERGSSPPDSAAQPVPVVTKPARTAPPAAILMERDAGLLGRFSRQRAGRPSGRFEATSKPDDSATVQVTIGRVEVRASTPPVSPPCRRSPPAATMSLDQYLKQRRAEGRS